MKKAYFLSDLHLVDPNDEKSLALLRFLRALKGRSELDDLFLVGDIFDLWISKHPYFIKRWFFILRELVRLKSEGVEIRYFEGNHDLYLKDYFYNQLGFHIYSQATAILWGNVNLRVEHGDEIDRTDYGYLFLRWFLRTAVIKKIIQKLPEFIILKIGESASQLSRNYTSKRPQAQVERVKKLLRQHAENTYQTEKYDLLVSGHLHVKDDIRVHSGRAINLGSWFDEYKVLYVTSDNSGLKAEWLAI